MSESVALVSPLPLHTPTSTSTIALSRYPSSSTQLPDAYVSVPSPHPPAPATSSSSNSTEHKSDADTTTVPASPVAIDFHSERQQLTRRIQAASTRAHLSLTKSTEAAGRVSDVTPDQLADLLSTDERAVLDTDVHLITQQQLAKRYGTDLVRGLTTVQVNELRVKYGSNVLTPPPAQSYIRLFVNQLVAGFSFILWLAAIVIFLSWQPMGRVGGATPQTINVGVAVVLVIVILTSAVFNFCQEVRAIQIVQSFNTIVPSTAHTIRDGRVVEVAASELVPGDLVELAMGDKVPADVRLLSVDGLQLNNSALTGESEPVISTKQSTSLNYLESHNLGFYSALIVQGRGTGLVTAIGDKTVLGQVSQLTHANTDNDTNLHREIRRFVLYVTVLALFTGMLTFIMWGAWLYRAHPLYMPPAAIIVNAFALIVAYVPEGLPVCVTLTLSMVAKRMYSQRVLARNLAIVETFNSVSIIATDKTGTLTLNQMTVQQVIWTNSGTNGTSSLEADGSDTAHPTTSVPVNISMWTPSAVVVSDSDRQQGSQWVMSQQSFGSSSIARQLFVGATLCNLADSQLQSDGSVSVRGDAVDAALYTLLRTKLAVNVVGQRQLTPRVAVQPFNSVTKCMVTLHSTASGSLLCYMKGAPELLLDRCSDVAEEQSDGSCRVVSLTAAKRSSILSMQEKCGREGLRLIGLCKLEYPADNNGGSQLDTTDPSQLPTTGYTFLGLFALRDPPRPSVADSVCRAHAAGIRVAMVTGDHPSTAQAIAVRVGIMNEACVRAGVRRVKLQADELGRAVMQMTVDGAVVETHVLGTGSVRGSNDGGDAHHSNGQSVSVSVVAEQPAAPATQHSSTWNSWWHRQFGLSHASSLVHRTPSIPHACVLTGSDIAAFDEYMWSWALQHRELVFARTSPEHKLKIVQELQRRGEVVAVTGDGVGDAPAIKRADCGVAMQAGAEVAREAADMVLLDNNFASIISAISEGRLVHDNLKKACLYLLPGSTWSEMWPLMFNVFLGVPLALSSFYMIVLSVVTDVVNALAIVQEQPESALMTRPPTVMSDNHLVDWRLLWHAYIELGTICSLSAWFNYIRYFQSRGIAVSDTFFAWSWGSESCCTDRQAGSAASAQCVLTDSNNCYSSGGRVFSSGELSDINCTGQSIFFVSLLVTNVFNMFSTRTRYTSSLQHNPLYGAGRNLWLVAATVAGSVVAVGLTRIGWFNDVFLTRPVNVKDVWPATGFGVALFVFDEVRKWVVRQCPRSCWARTAW